MKEHLQNLRTLFQRLRDKDWDAKLKTVLLLNLQWNTLDVCCHVKALPKGRRLMPCWKCLLPLMYPVYAHSWDQYNSTENWLPTWRHAHSHFCYAVRIHLGGGEQKSRMLSNVWRMLALPMECWPTSTLHRKLGFHTIHQTLKLEQFLFTATEREQTCNCQCFQDAVSHLAALQPDSEGSSCSGLCAEEVSPVFVLTMPYPGDRPQTPGCHVSTFEGVPLRWRQVDLHDGHFYRVSMTAQFNTGKLQPMATQMH